MAKRRKVDNPLALAVLSYLTRQPMHPYQLSRTLAGDGHARSIKFNHGSLYMVFGQLTKAGFIAPQGTTRDGQRPERTEYGLTEAGRAEMQHWLSDLVEQPQAEYPQFVAALSLIAALNPDDVVRLLNNRLGRLSTQRAEITELLAKALAAGEHPLFLVEEEYRLAVLDAEVGFVERFVQRITDPQTGWGPAWAEVLATFPVPAEPGTEPTTEPTTTEPTTTRETP